MNWRSATIEVPLRASLAERAARRQAAAEAYLKAPKAVGVGRCDLNKLAIADQFRMSEYQLRIAVKKLKKERGL